MKRCTYISTNKNKAVRYVGAAEDIERRINEQYHCVYPNAFTKRYNCYILVYFEEFAKVNEAFRRERQLKAGSRKKKEELINSVHPNWEDIGTN